MRGLGFAACAVTISLCAGPVLAQSLGEVVEKDKKRREALKGKARSYGDADLAAKRPTPEPEASPSPAPVGGALTWPTPRPTASAAPTATPVARTPDEKARASASAPGGAEYRAKASERYSMMQGLVMEGCMRGTPGGRATFWIHIDASGTLAEILYDTPSPYASCLADALRGKKFPPPPSGDFWFVQNMQWTAS